MKRRECVAGATEPQGAGRDGNDREQKDRRHELLRILGASCIGDQDCGVCTISRRYFPRTELIQCNLASKAGRPSSQPPVAVLAAGSRRRLQTPACMWRSAGADSAALEQVAGRLASCAGGRPAIVIGDICAKDGPAGVAAEALAALGGRIDILVNNAGGARPVTDKADDAFWDEALTLNFLAARRLTDLHRARDEGAKLGSDRLILPAQQIAPKLNGAAPAKAALVSWSRTLSSELGAHGITVNTVAPGRINSAQFKDFIRRSNPGRSSSSRTFPPATSVSLTTSDISWLFSPRRSPAISMARRSRSMAGRCAACSDQARRTGNSTTMTTRRGRPCSRARGSVCR